MFEIIMDVTNCCFQNCLLCGTNANRTGNIFLDASKIEETIFFAKKNNIFLYLGGGCFFCHPDYLRILQYMKSKGVEHIIIDVPPCMEIIDIVQKYPMSEYCYTISVSLWGIGDVHNYFSDSINFSYVNRLTQIMNHNQKCAAFSFVITKQLIKQKNLIIGFISDFGPQDSFYFHRLMPTGRCGEKNLPDVKDVKMFSEYVLGKHLKPQIRFHHTITEQVCTAYKNRLFIDWNGDAYGCGWVGTNKPFANIYNMSITEIMKEKERQKGYKCPLLGNIDHNKND